MKKQLLVLTIFIIIVTVSGCVETSIKTENNSPIAFAFADIVNGKAPLTISFTGVGNDTDGNIISFFWDFDDNTSSTSQNSTHTFQNSGIYNVILTVTDDNNGKAMDNLTITVISNYPPIANFAYTNKLYTVTFTDKSTDADYDILTYRWDFGDKETSTEENPVHTFDCSETNSFDITLTVSDGRLNDKYRKNILFGPNLKIIDYSQNWIKEVSEYSENEFTWTGYIIMSIRNDGNIPAEIAYAAINSKEKQDNYPVFYTKIRFNFTYTYDKLIESGGNGFGSELWITVISDNTLTLHPGTSLTVLSNPELTRVSWGVGSYPVDIWLFELRNEEYRSNTLYETIINLT